MASYNSWTTDSLVDLIQLLGHVPTSGNDTFDTNKLLSIAEVELQTPLIKQILSTRAGYYLDYADYAVADDGLYMIPSECVAGALVNIELIQDPTIIPVNLIEESEQFSTISPSSTSYGYFFKGNYVQILPIPNIGTARLWFSKRTSKMIPTSEAAQVSSVVGPVVTVASVPSTLSVGKYVDALGDQPPFNILGSFLQILDITGTDITLDNTVTGLGDGNWLALYQQTPIPQIPVEYRILLAQRVACKIYELQGYLPKMEAARKLLKEYEDATMSLITPRNKSQTKIINPNNGGFLSGRNRFSNFPAGRTS